MAVPGIHLHHQDHRAGKCVTCEGRDGDSEFRSTTSSALIASRFGQRVASESHKFIQSFSVGGHGTLDMVNRRLHRTSDNEAPGTSIMEEHQTGLFGSTIPR